MSLYSLVELATSLLCALLCVLHLFFHLADRRDRTQLWLAISLAGSCLLNASLAGSSGPAAGALGWSLVWLLVNVPQPLTWPAILLMIWAVADNRPVNGPRRAVLVLESVIACAISFGAFSFVLTHLHARMPTWEDVPVDAPITRLGSVGGPMLSVTAVVEAFLAWRRRGESFRILAVAGIATGMAAALEAWRQIHAPAQPSLIGLVGLPMILIGSTVMIGRYRAALGLRESRGGYRLVRKLGGGGMGELHLALRTGAGGFERAAALKRVLASRDAANGDVEALLAEARTAAKLLHPNIVAVHDVGRLETPEFGWFIAMEWLPGVDLHQVLGASRDRREPIPAAAVAAIGREACRGLAYAHARGVIHRDVSPHNVMLTFEGSVKLVDFGIASAIGQDPDGPGMLVGKVGYMAPERIRGGAPTPSGDLFALGVTLYEMLAGERPFLGADPEQTLQAIVAGVHRPVRDRRPDVPAALGDAVERALDPERALRWREAAEMAEALDRVARELPSLDLGAWVRELCGPEWAAQRPFAEDEIARTLSTMRLP